MRTTIVLFNADFDISIKLLRGHQSFCINKCHMSSRHLFGTFLIFLCLFSHEFQKIQNIAPDVGSSIQCPPMTRVAKKTILGTNFRNQEENADYRLPPNTRPRPCVQVGVERAQKPEVSFFLQNKTPFCLQGPSLVKESIAVFET